MQFWILFAVAMLVSSIGFKKFVWFISLGYGFSMAAIGVALFVMFGGRADVASLAICAMLVIYGLRLGGYLLLHERRSAAYNHVMKTQVNDGPGISRPLQVLIWAVCALLYVCEASTVLWRLVNGAPLDACVIVGACVMAAGIILESASDLQKSAQKKADPHRFCDKGLFAFVHCPNYFGEVLTWTGMPISGFTACPGVLQWVAVVTGWVGIVYVMFGGARRLEIRQNKNYGVGPDTGPMLGARPSSCPLCRSIAWRSTPGSRDRQEKRDLQAGKFWSFGVSTGPFGPPNGLHAPW